MQANLQLDSTLEAGTLRIWWTLVSDTLQPVEPHRPRPLTPPTEWEWSADLGGGMEGVSGHSGDDLQSLQDLRWARSHHLQDVSESLQQTCCQVTLPTDKYMGISTYSGYGTYCMPCFRGRKQNILRVGAAHQYDVSVHDLRVFLFSLSPLLPSLPAPLPSARERQTGSTMTATHLTQEPLSGKERKSSESW